VLAGAGLLILLGGVIPKKETFFPVSMAVIGALVVTAALVLGPGGGHGLSSASTSPTPSRASPSPDPARRRARPDARARLQRAAGLGRFEFAC
jgi:NADH-quinone oxidoreductase subunit N